MKKIVWLGDLSYNIFKKGHIQKDRGGDFPIWEKDPDSGHLYVTCPTCGKVNDISGHSMMAWSAGYIKYCVVCADVGCQSHFWVYLEGWNDV